MRIRAILKILRRNERKTIACLGDHSGVLTNTRMHSNIMPTEMASSAAPGLGSVLSRCEFTKTECALPSGVPSEMRTTMLVRLTYVLYRRLFIMSKLKIASVSQRTRVQHDYAPMAPAALLSPDLTFKLSTGSCNYLFTVPLHRLCLLHHPCIREGMLQGSDGPVSDVLREILCES